ncbi:MAG: hypothetical protein HYT80_02345, partial [Euryarchaeota archaeon]|nr:hypothetical protein [Euryarchaeota archaeon]
MIDSWAWIEYFRGTDAGKKARTHIEGEHAAVVSAVNIAEVFRWFLAHASAPHAE